MMMGIGWSISGPRRRRSRMPAPAPREVSAFEAVDVAEEFDGFDKVAGPRRD